MLVSWPINIEIITKLYTCTIMLYLVRRLIDKLSNRQMCLKICVYQWLHVSRCTVIWHQNMFAFIFSKNKMKPCVCVRAVHACGVILMAIVWNVYWLVFAINPFLDFIYEAKHFNTVFFIFYFKLKALIKWNLHFDAFN